MGGFGFEASHLHQKKKKDLYTEEDTSKNYTVLLRLLANYKKSNRPTYELSRVLHTDQSFKSNLI